MMKKVYVANTRCAAAAVVSAVVGWCSDKKIREPMMHRRLTTAGIEVAPHYHQILVMEGYNDSSCLKKLLAAARYLRLFLPQEPIG